MNTRIARIAELENKLIPAMRAHMARTTLACLKDVSAAAVERMEAEVASLKRLEIFE